MSTLDDLRSTARRRLAGPLPALPRQLDELSERWWSMPPRLRVGLTAGVCLLLACLPLVRTARSAWGPPVTVWVAATDLAAGTELGPDTAVAALRPADLVPGDALDGPDGVLTTAVIAGSVLTERHRAESLAAMLPRGHVAVPVPMDLQPQVAAGAVVDLLTAGFDGSGRVLVVGGRVLQVDGAFIWVAVPEDAAADAAAAAADQRLVFAVRGDAGADGDDRSGR